jgi:hypothetical protein
MPVEVRFQLYLECFVFWCFFNKTYCHIYFYLYSQKHIFAQRHKKACMGFLFRSLFSFYNYIDFFIAANKSLVHQHEKASLHHKYSAYSLRKE